MEPKELRMGREGKEGGGEGKEDGKGGKEEDEKGGKEEEVRSNGRGGEEGIL